MRKITLSLIVLLIALVPKPCFSMLHGHAGYSSALNVDGAIPLPYVPGEVLVRWKENAPVHPISQLKSTMGIREKKTFHSIGVHHVRIPPSMRIEEALAELRGNPLVEYAEPNYIIRVLATFPNDPPFDPGDPNYGTLWGLHNITSDADIDAPEAWDITQGDHSVVIAVIDTGVAHNHPDLDDGSDSNIWTNPGEIPDNSSDDDNNDYIDDVHGWDFLGKDNGPTDYY